MNINLDPETTAKIIVGLFSAAGGLAAGARFAAPFAEQFFKSWLARAERREQARLDQERADREASTRVLVALEGSVRVQEHHVGVLENIDARLAKVDERLEALLAHHGVVLGRPSPPPPRIEPRATLPGVGVTSTGQYPAALPAPSPGPGPASERSRGG